MVTQEQANRIEGKLDELLEFADQVKAAIEGFSTGPMAKLMAGMVRGVGGGGR